MTFSCRPFFSRVISLSIISIFLLVSVASGQDETTSTDELSVANDTIIVEVAAPTSVIATDYKYDNQGRTTQVLGPAHNVDGTTVRTAAWTTYSYDGGAYPNE